MQCTRVTDIESCYRQCPKEAVYKGLCRGCAWVELPEEREMLPPKQPRQKQTRTAAKKPKPNRDEAHLQVALCKYLKALPSTLYWHTPSSFYRGANSGPGFFGYIARLKAMGWFSGIPDLCIIFRNIHGATTICFAELKVGYGTTSDAQDLFLDRANSLGCFTAKVKSLDDLMALLRAAGHPSLTESK